VARPPIDQGYLLTDQYRDATKLDARVQLHVRFSSNKYGWQSWVFDHLLHLPVECRLLELGCGPGHLWRDNQQRIPAGWDITLSDFSAGMLRQAKENLGSIARDFAFEVVDALAIPFDDATFDAVIANHMLYHVPDRTRVLSEIRRVLKPGGRFVASTVGESHLRELSDLVRRFDAGLIFWGMTDTFTLENGHAQIEQWFSDVTLSRYEDELIITEPEPLNAFILSGPSIPQDRREAFTRFVEAEMKAQPTFRVTKDTGIFEAARRASDR
jgi:ubiquinone/menaquinone biosynthesis C-methylase UbiE